VHSLPKKLAAEFIGTFALIFIGAGSICANQFMGAGGGGIVAIALAHGLTIAVMVSALAHISGGHFNPAVTVAFWVTRKMDTVESLLYWVAQLAGGIAGAYLLLAVIPEDTWRAVRLGTPSLAPEITNLSAMLLEAVLTFFLVTVVFGAAVDEHGAAARMAGLAIGLTVTLDIFLGGPFTGAAMNPARALGPALAGNYWSSHGVYWVGPLAGGVFAGWLYDALYLKKRVV